MKKYICLLIFCILPFILCGCKNETIKQKIDPQNFVTVTREIEVLNYDLRNKSIFNKSGYAYKKGVRYKSGQKKRKSPNEFEDLKESMLYDYIATNDTLTQIRKRHYILIKTGNFDIDGVKSNKIKIYYNHRGIPTRLYLYSLKLKEWRLKRQYTYYYHSEIKYNKELNKCIMNIMNSYYDQD